MDQDIEDIANAMDSDWKYDVLYHGTHKSKLNGILSKGLDPAESIWADDERANDDQNWGPPYHFVYLSPSIEGAEEWGPVVLEIRLPPELQSKLITDRGEFTRAPFLIPPQFIKVVKGI